MGNCAEEEETRFRELLEGWLFITRDILFGIQAMIPRKAG